MKTLNITTAITVAIAGLSSLTSATSSKKDPCDQRTVTGRRQVVFDIDETAHNISNINGEPPHQAKLYPCGDVKDIPEYHAVDMMSLTLEPFPLYTGEDVHITYNAITRTKIYASARVRVAIIARRTGLPDGELTFVWKNFCEHVQNPKGVGCPAYPGDYILKEDFTLPKDACNWDYIVRFYTYEWTDDLRRPHDLLGCNEIRGTLAG